MLKNKYTSEITLPVSVKNVCEKKPHMHFLYMILRICFKWSYNHMAGIIVSMLTLSAVGSEFEPRSGQTTETIKLVFVPSLAKHAKTSWLRMNQDNVSEWSNMSTHELLFQ